MTVYNRKKRNNSTSALNAYEIIMSLLPLWFSLTTLYEYQSNVRLRHVYNIIFSISNQAIDLIHQCLLRHRPFQRYYDHPFLYCIRSRALGKRSWLSPQV